MRCSGRIDPGSGSGPCTGHPGAVSGAADRFLESAEEAARAEERRAGESRVDAESRLKAESRLSAESRRARESEPGGRGRGGTVSCARAARQLGAAPRTHRVVAR